MKTAQGRGFTLIELLVVIAIMGMLMAMVVVGLPRVLEKAKITINVSALRRTARRD